MQAAKAEIGAIVGQENLQRISIDDPLRVLHKEALQPMTLSAAMTAGRRKRWWRLW
jgi:hypothetical protein